MDAGEQKVVNDIDLYGWHMCLIPADDEGPAFAYSVGLNKSFSHPEVVIFGLAIEVMHGIINVIGGLIKGGERFSAGDSSMRVVEGFEVRFRAVGIEHYSEYLGFGSWYYKTD